MSKLVDKFKGIPPGIVIDRELKKRSLKQRSLALSIGEHPQTLNNIIRARRSISTPLALKIEKELGLEEGSLSVLQVYYDIKKEKEKLKSNKPDLSQFRTSLFWDTNIDRLDWDRKSKAVIERVFERGNLAEKKELLRFYGKARLREALKSHQERKPIRLHKNFT